MEPNHISDPALAAAITKSASQQSYYTIRLLVDRDLVDDAYRAYAYFRWMDDWLDEEMRPRPERLAFVKRQQALLESCSGGDPPADLVPEERLLADLLSKDLTGFAKHPGAKRRGQNLSGLQAYVHNMMAVMAFDAERRGQLVSRRELDAYTRWLAVAVTEALHYFIGHDGASPQGEIRYLAATGAHITHMLRDALDDAEMGYYNVPREVLGAHGIDPWDVESKIYRDWVRERVRKARACFRTGRDYLAQVKNLRCRIAGYAYIHRFEVELDWMERVGCLLQARSPVPKSLTQGVERFAWALWMALSCRRPAHTSPVLALR
ncbi:MAG: squalene/phytoene synthase family protein [Thermoflexales bacterium]|nr:squalene/phytoene synthase family protein [Thermoflexales bacterium]